ncbi:MAG: hypothetical protein ACJ70Z_00185 [Nitrososphaera sp.]
MPLFYSIYYSKNQSKELSVDIETKVLNYLDDKLHNMAELVIALPELDEVVDKESANQRSKELVAI